jgi:hypothetical protein
MNDKELAEPIVALGVGSIIELQEPHSGSAYVLADEMIFLTAESFVRDWRVAGAMMEKCLASGIDVGMNLQSNYFEAPGFWITGTIMELSQDIETESDGNGSLPRAINLACVEALAPSLVAILAARCSGSCDADYLWTVDLT